MLLIKEAHLRNIIKGIIVEQGLVIDKMSGASSSFTSGGSVGADSYKDVPQVTGNYPKANIQMVINELEAEGVTNSNAILGVLATVAKESGFVPKVERSYSDTSNARIKEVFGGNTIKVNVTNPTISAGTKVSNLSDDVINQLKANDQTFFNALYGGRSSLGNGDFNSNDGYNFRGRGFNQLTGRSNYRKAGFESNPDAVNSARNAAKVVAKFMTTFHPNVWSKDELNSASNPSEGTIMAADINGGERNKLDGRARNNALARLGQFIQMLKDGEIKINSRANS